MKGEKGEGNGVVGNGIPNEQGGVTFRDIDTTYLVRRINDGSQVSWDSKGRTATILVGNSGQLGRVKVPYEINDAGGLGDIRRRAILEGFAAIGIELPESHAFLIDEILETKTTDFLNNLPRKKGTGILTTGLSEVKENKESQK